MHDNRPQLLVSVRNAVEARVAVQAGVDLLDVKEPARGALGMADAAVMTDVLAVASSARIRVDVSAALGDAPDWLAPRGRSAPVPLLPDGLAFIKLGTARLAPDDAWVHAWRAALQHVLLPLQDRPARPPRRVAVAFGDWRAAQAPPPAAVIAAASEMGCSGILIDTHVKDGTSLLDSMTHSELAACIAAAHRQHLTLALAGSLKPGDVARLIELQPDIIGVRSAACHNGRRDAPIDAAAVRYLTDLFRSAHRAPPCGSPR